MGIIDTLNEKVFYRQSTQAMKMMDEVFKKQIKMSTIPKILKMIFGENQIFDVLVKIDLKGTFSKIMAPLKPAYKNLKYNMLVNRAVETAKNGGFSAEDIEKLSSSVNKINKSNEKITYILDEVLVHGKLNTEMHLKLKRHLVRTQELDKVTQEFINLKSKNAKEEGMILGSSVIIGILAAILAAAMPVIGAGGVIAAFAGPVVFGAILEGTCKDSVSLKITKETRDSVKKALEQIKYEKNKIEKTIGKWRESSIKSLSELFEVFKFFKDCEARGKQYMLKEKKGKSLKTRARIRFSNDILIKKLGGELPKLEKTFKKLDSDIQLMEKRMHERLAN